MEAFALRLQREDEEAGWDLNEWADGANMLLELAESRAELILDETWAAFAPLANCWSDDEATAIVAVRLLELLFRHNADTGRRIADDWIERAVSEDKELGVECLAWLGVHFSNRLNASQREQLQESLTEVVSHSAVTEHESWTLQTIISNMTPKDRLDDEMQALLRAMLSQTNSRHANANEYLDRIVPPMALLVEVYPIGFSGPQLLSLFSRTHSSPPAYARLHTYMLGHWPKASSEGAQVEFQPLFDQSLAILRGYSNTEGVGDILRSLSEMIDSELLSRDNDVELVTVASEVWASQRSAALEVLLATHAAPSEGQIAQLAKEVNPASDEDVSDLTLVWNHHAGLIDPSKRLAVAMEILAQAPISTSAAPDLSLQLWVDSQGPGVPDLLRALMASDTLNDSQYVRVWYQVDRALHLVDESFLVRVLPSILTTQEQNVARAVLETRAEITDRFVGPAARHDLTQVVLDAFFGASSTETKRMLVTWLSELGDESFLKQLKNRTDVQTEDLILLLEKFPSNRSLKSLHNKMIRDE